MQAPVHLAFDIFKDGTQFHLVGRVQSTLALSCGRCLDDIELPVDLPFDLLYLPHQEHAGGEEAEVEVEDDDLTTAYYQDDEIDLGQLVLEQFYLARADEAVVPRVLPRPVPRVRDEPQYGHLFLRARVDGPQAGRPAVAPRQGRPQGVTPGTGAG